MNYTPPSGTNLLFDWQGKEKYTPPQGVEITLSWQSMEIPSEGIRLYAGPLLIYAIYAGSSPVEVKK